MRVVLLIAVEIAFFMLFVAFMLANQMGMIVAFLYFYPPRDFPEKWEKVNRGLLGLLKERRVLSTPLFIFLCSPYRSF